MALKSFIYYLDDTLESRIREEIYIEKGKVIKFIVQFEALIGKKWQYIVRYDTAHSFVHRDTYFPNGSQSKSAIPFLNFNEALTFAEKDLKNNWKKYKERFQKELREGGKNDKS